MGTSEDEIRDWLLWSMKVRRLTMRQVAHLTGVNASTVSRLLAGGTRPAWRTVLRISDGLGIAPPGGGDRVRGFRIALDHDPVLTAMDRRRILAYYLGVRRTVINE